jgi:hypothetical protein
MHNGLDQLGSVDVDRSASVCVCGVHCSATLHVCPRPDGVGRPGSSASASVLPQ